MNASDQIPASWNDTAVDYRSDVTLDMLFQEQVKRTPDRIAVQFEDQELTYSELNDRAERVASVLHGGGIGPESLVGICLQRSLEMVVGLYGILRSGAAYVPIDPENPQDRIAFMLSDSGVETLLTHSGVVDDLPHFSGNTLCLDLDIPADVSQQDSENIRRCEPDNLAYVIYTSGSTGTPKGAMNEHRAICNRLFWMQSEYGLTADDVLLQKTPFSFDVSVWEFFWPLLNGAKLVVAKPDGHRDPGYLAQLISDEGVTVIHFVPSMLQVFLEEADLESKCASLRHVICSGEALPVALRDRFFERISSQLHNLYGPTEAAIDVTHWTCVPDGAGMSIPIGRPVANTQIHILNDRGRRVPVGETGELHIGGVQVARGYLNRPDLTAEKFIPDPFDSRTGARLYRTGDLARWLPDGTIDFLGREDNQVKIRGFRIELGEIETVIDRSPGVRQSVVVASEHSQGFKQLVAYFTVEEGKRVEIANLRQSLDLKLPDYMVPSMFVQLDRIPLSPNGKVDRKALPTLDRRARPQLSVAYVAPRNPLETFIAKCWSELVGVELVGIHDPFFDIGGDSLRAAQFVNRMQRELGENMYVVAIFDAPTVAQMATFLIKDYRVAVENRFGEVAGPTPHDVRLTGKVDETTLARLRDVVVPLSFPDAPSRGPRNRRAVFVLAPPRSGTTLLRVMLAGHRSLFAAAELQLLGFQSLDERRKAYSGKFKLWLEGTVRAIMEVRSCDADEAWAMMTELESRKLSTKDFFGLLQDWIGDRTLVDKSPSYALDPLSLRKAEADFEDAFYIHLVRHPYAMVKSFENYHMHQVLFLRDHNLTPRQLGESVWTLSHLNTVDFLASVPEHRQLRIKYEDLVVNPRAHMVQLCDKLEIEFDEAMVNPYRNIDKKMTDGLYADSTPMGDTRLLERTEIDPAVADSWRGVLEDNFLGDVTWSLAEDIGFERPLLTEASTIPPGLRHKASGRRGQIDQLRAGRKGRRA